MNTQKMTKKNDLAIVNTHIACGGEDASGHQQTLCKPNLFTTIMGMSQLMSSSYFINTYIHLSIQLCKLKYRANLWALRLTMHHGCLRKGLPLRASATSYFPLQSWRHCSAWWNARLKTPKPNKRPIKIARKIRHEYTLQIVPQHIFAEPW